MNTTFFRLLNDKDKGSALKETIEEYRRGAGESERIFEEEPEKFSKVPNSPFAYWVDDSIRELFEKLPPFESEGRTVKQGLATADDFRFVRAWWEVNPAKRLDPGLAGAPDWREELEDFQKWCRKRTSEGKYWVPFAKGGEYSPYYSDIHLVVKWKDEGREIKNNRNEKGNIRSNVYMLKKTEKEYFFRPGLTWSYRSHRLCGQVLNSGIIISVRGSGLYCKTDELPYYISLMNSKLVDFLIKIQMGRGGHPQFDQGDLKILPVPSVDKNEKRNISSLGSKAIIKTLVNEINNQVSILFYDYRNFNETKSEIFYTSEKINKKVEELYGVRTPYFYKSEMFFTDKSKVNPIGEIEYNISLAFARCDIRMALDQSLIPEIADPFEPLPVVPPATLVGPDGLPATFGRIVSEQWLRSRPDAISLPEEGSVASPTILDDEYSIPIPWDGILVDDPENDADIVSRIRKVLEVLHGDEAEQREQELIEELGVKSLREYLQKPTGFFADHLTRYTKSRRKAPIYWPLSAGKGRYTIWIYYPRLNESTLFTAVNSYIDPKLNLVRRELEEIRQDKSRRGRFDELTELAEELETMRRTLLEIGELPYKPDHDDGVPICAAPLAPLIRHSGWRKTLQDEWKKLERGEYDWARLAYAIWPERVRQKAKEDRSIAIAHDLEEK